MKLYSNSILSMPLSGCAACPNKKAQHYKTAKGFASRFECQALNHNRYDYSVAGNKLTFHPPVTDAIRLGGFLEDCPLPDVEAASCSLSIPSPLSTTPQSIPQGE